MRISTGSSRICEDSEAAVFVDPRETARILPNSATRNFTGRGLAHPFLAQFGTHSDGDGSGAGGPSDTGTGSNGRRAGSTPAGTSSLVIRAGLFSLSSN